MILIVEDEPVSRRALQSLLRMCGYATTAVESGEAGLRAMAGQNPPGVALVDVDLPGMSGLDFIERLKQSNPEIRPVLITAAESDKVNAFRNSHDVGYMRKPVNFQHLIEIIGPLPN